MRTATVAFHVGSAFLMTTSSVLSSPTSRRFGFAVEVTRSGAGAAGAATVACSACGDGAARRWALRAAGWVLAAKSSGRVEATVAFTVSRTSVAVAGVNETRASPEALVFSSSGRPWTPAAVSASRRLGTARPVAESTRTRTVAFCATVSFAGMSIFSR